MTLKKLVSFIQAEANPTSMLPSDTLEAQPSSVLEAVLLSSASPDGLDPESDEVACEPCLFKMKCCKIWRFYILPLYESICALAC